MMKAFYAQATMELRYQLRRPFVWICAAIFFAIAFGDAFQAGISGEGYHWVNGAESILTHALIFSLFGILAAAGIVGESTSRDRQLHTEEQVLSSGAGPFGLGLGRFLITWLICIATAATFVPGQILGSMMPGIAPEQLGPTDLSHYWKAMLYILIPNFFITSALVYAVGVRWRSQTIAFLAGVALLIAWVTARMQLGQDVMRHDVFAWYALFDPFASIAVSEFSIEWTVAQNNSRFVPFDGMLFWNRLLWLGIATLLVLASIRWMPMRLASTGKQKKGKQSNRRITANHKRSQFGLMMQWELVTLSRQPGVILLLVLAGFTIWLAASSSLTHQYSLPSTDLLVHSTGFYFDKILVLMIAWFAGELIWRERQHGVHELNDAMPVPDTTQLLVKTLVLFGMVLVFWLLSIVVNILYQLTHGFFNTELDLYLLDSLIFKAPPYLWLAALAISLQVIIRRRFIAIGVFLLIYILPVLFDALGWFHPVYRFGEINFFWYSPLSGYGHFWHGHLWMLLYWTLGSVLIWTIAWAVYTRGVSPPSRRALLCQRLANNKPRLTLSGTALAFTLTGGAIWIQTTHYNQWPPLDVNALKAEVEKQYGEEWRGRIQPRVIAIRSEVDLYPEQRRLEVHGELTLINPYDQAITELLVMSEPELTSTTVKPGRRATLVNRNDHLRVEHWHLDQPLQPGERMQLAFKTLSRPNPGFRAHAKNDDVTSVSRLELISNGSSLLNLQLMPAIGYTDRVEHKPGWKRRKYGLPSKWPAPEGDYALNQPHDTLHLGWVERIDTTITTSAEQLPLHAGQVVDDQVLEDGRRRIRYLLEGPARGWSTILSASLETRSHETPGLPPMTFYYNPDQTYTLDTMIETYSDAMAYFTEHYGQAPFKEFRLAQQSLHYDGMGNRAGMGFASEILGWKSDLSQSEGAVIDRMAAHMMGMSWFGDQLIPANLPGAKIIHAGLPYWSAGLYLHQKHGRLQSRKLRKQTMAEMFRKRRGLRDEESAFMEEHKDSSMIRAKGSIFMAYLAELIGQEKVEAALADFLNTWKYHDAPFPTAVDFVDHLRQQLPELPAQQFDDIFENITRWDLRVEKASTYQLEDGRWQTEATIEARKFYTSGLGDEEEASEFATPIFIAVAADRQFTDSAVFQLIEPPSGKSNFKIISDNKPLFIGLDPDYLLPDSNLRNQVIKIQ